MLWVEEGEHIGPGSQSNRQMKDEDEKTNHPEAKQMEEAER